MEAQALSQWLTRRPFEPFEVRLVTGKWYAVVHPELAEVQGENLVIRLGESAAEPAVARKTVVCPLRHVREVRRRQTGEG